MYRQHVHTCTCTFVVQLQQYLVVHVATHVIYMYVMNVVLHRTTCTVVHECMFGALSDLRAVKKQHFGIHHPPAEILSLKSSIAQFFTKSSAKDAGPGPASFEPTFMAIGKILDLSDKIYTGENIWGRFWSILVDFQKNVKNVSKKNLLVYCIVV